MKSSFMQVTSKSKPKSSQLKLTVTFEIYSLRGFSFELNIKSIPYKFNHILIYKIKPSWYF